MSTQSRSRISVYAIAEREGRLLLARLSEDSPVFEPGAWHLPGGGIDSGEQPLEALKRELHEETGLTLLDARLLDARSYRAHRNGIDWDLVALFYSVELGDGLAQVVEANGSTDAAAWVPLADLDGVELSPPTADAVALIR
ncbi:NUDIX domain-containing protein [Streptomyces sp. NPDC051211]|uniref:NUDIX domain-containing protein n=1 Tax=Streptomyces sp. NPDC051211 TaxID=3154643 RepID=UPI00344FF86F